MSFYKPGHYEGMKCVNATLAFKFSNDIFLARSFLIKKNIPFKEEDLEDGPWGRGLRVKRDKK